MITDCPFRHSQDGLTGVRLVEIDGELEVVVTDINVIRACLECILDPCRYDKPDRRKRKTESPVVSRASVTC